MNLDTAYIPNPIDTSNIELSEELLALSEQLAKHVHDVWAKGRIAEGWTYGENRDSQNKTTPCLVDYECLPESEKEYDRRTAFETLKVIKALGFDIIKIS